MNRPDCAWALIFMMVTAAIIFVFLRYYAPTEKLYWAVAATNVEVKSATLNNEKCKQGLNNLGMMYDSMNERLNAVEGRKTDGKNAGRGNSRGKSRDKTGN